MALKTIDQVSELIKKAREAQKKATGKGSQLEQRSAAKKVKRMKRKRSRIRKFHATRDARRSKASPEAQSPAT